jgi:hypothetical protein
VYTIFTFQKNSWLILFVCTVFNKKKNTKVLNIRDIIYEDENDIGAAVTTLFLMFDQWKIPNELYSYTHRLHHSFNLHISDFLHAAKLEFKR